MDQDPGSAQPATLAELARHGWQIIANALTAAESENALIAHWFLTPDDSSVHMDPHFGDDDRTAKFLRVVVPTLADQLGASMLWVAVPWGIDTDAPLMVLLSAFRGQRPMIEGRRLTRSQEAGGGPPWWSVESEPAELPEELLALAERMVI